MTKSEAKSSLEFHRAALQKLRDAYLALVDGGVQSYSIGSRSLTKFDLSDISDEIQAHERKIAELEAVLRGGSRRRAVGVVPRDF
jgi:hypothetical protein